MCSELLKCVHIYISIVAEAGDVIAEAGVQDLVPGQESLASFSDTVNYNHRFYTVMSGIINGNCNTSQL